MRALALVFIVTVVFVACGGGLPVVGGGGGGSAAGGGTAMGGGSEAGGGASSGPHISLPDCGTPDDAGTAQDVYNNVVIPNGCNAGGCHGPGGVGTHYMFSDAASMRSVWVDAGADEAPMKRVSPGYVDQSYVLYKVCGQQADAGGSGVQMPQGGPYLPESQICALANWIRAGAP